MCELYMYLRNETAKKKNENLIDNFFSYTFALLSV